MPSGMIPIADPAITRGMNTVDDPKVLQPGEAVRLLNAFPGNPPIPGRPLPEIEQIAFRTLKDCAIEPGQPFGIDLVGHLLAKLQLALWPKRPCHDLGGAVANTMRNIVAGDVEGLAVLGDAPNQDMRVRVTRVEVIDGDPVEVGAQVLLHLCHQVAGDGLERVELRAILG